ncbi:MAG TPA: VWA domain-containing protein [Planctomycetota bacterium]|nr:VWA domain-containing protein [Planctomycetota bacterium]
MSSLLPALLAQQTTDTTTFKWLAAPPAWVTFLVVLATAAFVAFVYAREASPAGRAKRGFLAVLRALAILGVFAVLADLVAQTNRQEVRPSWVVVMIDDSVSMTLKDRFADRAAVDSLAAATGVPASGVEDLTRLDLVKKAMSRDDWAIVRGLAEKNKLKVYSFSSKPMPVAEVSSADAAEKTGPSAGASTGASTATGAEGGLRGAMAKVGAMDATGPETAIGDSLNKVINETRGQHVAGIVLITDGRSNSGALPPLKVARRLKSRGIPLYTIGVGNPDEPKDIALSDLQCPEVVISTDQLPIKASVKSQGFEGDTELIVRLDDEVVKSETISLQGKGARQDISVRIKPDKPGEYTLSLEIPPKPGELIQDNNRLSQRIRVIDKRIKVLYVDWRARYEFRFLRWGLIRDKNMEAHTYLIDADPEFVQDATPGLTPLNDVPKTREELFQYHVIVLGDIDPHDPHMGDERMKLIREFVEDYGGGLLVISGQHFMPRAYAGTPLEGLLPVVIDPGDEDLGSSQRPITEEFHPKLTLDGRRNPTMQLENDPQANIDLWDGRGQYAQGLPGFFWYYTPKEKKRTAEVLAVHPERQTSKQEPVPIFAIQTVGAGTCFYSATDDVWRWRAGVGDRYTYRLWGQAIRYLSTGRLLKSKRFSITTDKPVYDLGEKVVIAAEVNDRSMKPATDETQSVFLQGPDGGAPERIELARPPQLQGRYEGSRLATKVGTYKLWIASGPNPEHPDAGEELATRVFQVQVPVLEKSDPKMDEELLKKMAQSTGGQHFRLGEIDRLPKAVGTIREVSEVRVSEREMWDRWWVLCGLVGVLAMEWLLRKAWKML